MTASEPAFKELRLNLTGEAALELLVAELEDEVVLLVVVPEAATVVPKAGVVGTGAVIDGRAPVEVPVVVPVLVDVVDVVEVVSPEMEKLPLVEYTVLMFEMSTASKVYPSPTGTIGNVIVSVPAADGTLFATPKLLLKTVFTR